MDNRRKKIVINRKFQHQYALIVVVMTVFLTNIVIILRSLFPGDQPFTMSSSQALTIGILELVLVVGAWYGSIRASHKIAGPVFVFSRQLKAVGGGDLWARISLRKGDMFQEEAAAINTSLQELQGMVTAVKSAADELKRAQESGADTTAALDRLMSGLAALRTTREE